MRCLIATGVNYQEKQLITIQGLTLILQTGVIGASGTASRQGGVRENVALEMHTASIPECHELPLESWIAMLAAG